MSEPHLTTPDELHLYIEEQLARINRERAERDRRLQEFAQAPTLLGDFSEEHEDESIRSTDSDVRPDGFCRAGGPHVQSGRQLHLL
jgi:hypothetical protein